MGKIKSANMFLLSFLFFFKASFAIKVESFVCGEYIKNRTPVNVSNVFSKSVKKIYCFTKVKTEEYPTHIYHIWYYNGRKIGSIKLNIKYPVYRTWSYSRNLGTGRYTVVLTDANGKKLGVRSFRVAAYNPAGNQTDFSNPLIRKENNIEQIEEKLMEEFQREIFQIDGNLRDQTKRKENQNLNRQVQKRVNVNRKERRADLDKKRDIRKKTTQSKKIVRDRERKTTTVSKQSVKQSTKVAGRETTKKIKKEIVKTQPLKEVKKRRTEIKQKTVTAKDTQKRISLQKDKSKDVIKKKMDVSRLHRKEVKTEKKISITNKKTVEKIKREPKIASSIKKTSTFQNQKINITKEKPKLTKQLTPKIKPVEKKTVKPKPKVVTKQIIKNPVTPKITKPKIVEKKTITKKQVTTLPPPPPKPTATKKAIAINQNNQQNLISGNITSSQNIRSNNVTSSQNVTLSGNVTAGSNNVTASSVNVTSDNLTSITANVTSSGNITSTNETAHTFIDLEENKVETEKDEKRIKISNPYGLPEKEIEVIDEGENKYRIIQTKDLEEKKKQSYIFLLLSFYGLFMAVIVYLYRRYFT